MARENVEELGPFGRASGVGHVAGDENKVERPGGVLGLEARHHLLHPLIAAGPAPPALDAKAIALAHDMDVGQMRDPPDRPSEGAASNASRSSGWSMLASAKPQTSEAAAR